MAHYTITRCGHQPQRGEGTLDDVTNEMLTDVVRKDQKKLARGTVDPGRVIADATLGVWVHLLSRGGRGALADQSTKKQGSGGFLI